MNIDQDIQVVSIQAPQDNEIAKMGTDLNQTYTPYGATGQTAYEKQAKEDVSASVFSRAVTHVERAIFKSKAQYDSAATWDLVNEVTSGRVKPEEVKKEQLPNNLQKLNGQELKMYIDGKIAERQTIQKRINELSQERRQYIAGKEKEMAQNQGQETLGQAMLKAVRSQASKKQFHFKD